MILDFESNRTGKYQCLRSINFYIYTLFMQYVYLFSYGTLQVPDIQLSLFGRYLHGEQDYLPGYISAPIQIGSDSHLIAIPSQNPSTQLAGTVLEVTPEELVIADNYETAEYKRIEVQLASGKTSWVYVAV
jgi:hypothetical protein